MSVPHLMTVLVCGGSDILYDKPTPEMYSILFKFRRLVLSVGA